MLTIRCKVIELGKYSVVVTIPRTLDVINHMKIRNAYDCNLWVIKDDVAYPHFDIKDVIHNDTTIIMYFGKYPINEFDLVNDKDATVVLQIPFPKIRSVEEMIKHDSDVIYESN